VGHTDTRARLSLLGVAALLSFSLPAAAEPVVWHATHPAYSGELILLGSIHVLRAVDYPLPQIVDEAYGRADEVVFELDLDDIDPVAAQTNFLGAAMLPQDESLQSVLDADVFADAAAHAQDLGLTIDLLERFEPWFVALNLMNVGMTRLGYDANFGVDRYLLRKALSDGKEVLGLEDLREQVAVFDDLSAAQQQAVLSQTLHELDRTDEILAEMAAAWRDGRLDELQSELLEAYAEFPELYAPLVENRNRAWITKLEALAANDATYLVVVGALHLVGDNSVVELLRARGFEVTALQ
jgi:uncharacterized protein YbaP (TraB family)